MDYKKLESKLKRIGIVIPGNIQKKYQRCGKDYCPCMKSEKNQHGPYHSWNFKIDQKFTSKLIPDDKLQDFRQWISNREKLNEVVDIILNYGQSYAISSLKKKIKDNSK